MNNLCIRKRWREEKHTRKLLDALFGRRENRVDRIEKYYKKVPPFIYLFICISFNLGEWITQ